MTSEGTLETPSSPWILERSFLYHINISMLCAGVAVKNWPAGWARSGLVPNPEIYGNISRNNPSSFKDYEINACILNEFNLLVWTELLESLKV